MFLTHVGVRLAHLMDDGFTSLSGLCSLEVSLDESEVPVGQSLFKPGCELMPQLTRVHVWSRREP